MTLIFRFLRIYYQSSPFLVGQKYILQHCKHNVFRLMLPRSSHQSPVCQQSVLSMAVLLVHSAEKILLLNPTNYREDYH